MKVLLDTCVVIDALQSRKPFEQDAQNIFLAAGTGQCQAYITAKEVTDIYYLLHRSLHSNLNARAIMSKLFALFPVLDTSADDVENAIVSSLADYEDAVMVETAKREQMDCIVTRNLTDFKNAGIPVYSPADFLQKTGCQNPDSL